MIGHAPWSWNALLRSVFFCLGCVLPLHAAHPVTLEEVYEGVTAVPHIAMFNESTLGSDLVATMQKLTKLRQIQLHSAECTTVDPLSASFSCEGHFQLHQIGGVEVAGAIAVFGVEEDQLGLAVDFVLEGDRAGGQVLQHLDLFSQPILHERLEWGEVGSLRLQTATHEFTVNDLTIGRGYRLQGRGLRTSNWLDLNELIPDLKTMKLGVEIWIPFHRGSFDVDLDSATMELHTDVHLTIGASISFVDLVVQVQNFKNPQVQLKANAKFRLPKESTDLVAEMSCNWQSSGDTKKLDWEGSLTSSVAPFKEHKGWWSLSNGHFKATMAFGNGQPISLPSLRMSGLSKLLLGSFPVVAETNLVLENNAKLFSVEINIKESQKLQWNLLNARMYPNVESLDFLQALSQKVFRKQVPISKEVYQQAGSLTAWVTNMDTVQNQLGKSVPSGASVCAFVGVLASSTLERLLNPAFGGSVVEDMLLNLNTPLSTFQGKQDSSIRVDVNLDVAKIMLHRNVELIDTKLTLKDLISADFHSKLSWKPEGKPAVEFEVSTQWTKESSDVLLEGSLGRPEDLPLPSWLNPQSARLYALIQNGWLEDLKVDAEVLVSFSATSSQQYTINLVVSDQFRHFFFVMNIQIDSTDPEKLIESILHAQGRRSQESNLYLLHDTEFVRTEVDIIACSDTCEHRGTFYPSGVTVLSESRIIANSGLMRKLAALFQDDDANSMIFEFDFHIPASSSSSFTLKLRTQSIHIRDNMEMQRISVNIDMGSRIAFGISGSLQVKFQSIDTPMVFSIDGKVHSSGIMDLSGGLIQGLETRVFYLPGLSLTNAFVHLSTIPVSPYLMKFGVGGDFEVGTVKVVANGYVDLKNPTDLFFISRIQSIGLRDLFMLYNRVHVAENPKLRAYDLIDTDKIPKALKLSHLVIHLAPRDKILNIDAMQVVFKEGLALVGRFPILGMEATTFNLRSVQDEEGHNFLADFDLHLPTIQDVWKVLMDYLFPAKQTTYPIYPGLNDSMWGALDDAHFKAAIEHWSHWIPQLTRLAVESVNFRKIRKGETEGAFFLIDIFFRGETHSFSNGMTFDQLSGDFSELMKGIDWSKMSAPQIQECFVNADCESPERPYCFHATEDHPLHEYCVAQCDKASEFHDVFGCMTSPFLALAP